MENYTYTCSKYGETTFNYVREYDDTEWMKKKSVHIKLLKATILKLLARVPGLHLELWTTIEKVPFSFIYDFRKLNGFS